MNERVCHQLTYTDRVRPAECRSTAHNAAERSAGQPALTFVDVIAAVERAPDLTSGVRANLRSAVERTADLFGVAGPAATVDVPSIARRLANITAAKLGFKSENSLAAFRSNLRRALRIAGVPIMAGKASSHR